MGFAPAREEVMSLFKIILTLLRTLRSNRALPPRISPFVSNWRSWWRSAWTAKAIAGGPGRVRRRKGGHGELAEFREASQATRIIREIRRTRVVGSFLIAQVPVLEKNPSASP